MSEDQRLNSSDGLPQSASLLRNDRLQKRRVGDHARAEALGPKLYAIDKRRPTSLPPTAFGFLPIGSRASSPPTTIVRISDDSRRLAVKPGSDSVNSVSELCVLCGEDCLGTARPEVGALPWLRSGMIIERACAFFSLAARGRFRLFLAPGSQRGFLSRYARLGSSRG